MFQFILLIPLSILFWNYLYYNKNLPIQNVLPKRQGHFVAMEQDKKQKRNVKQVVARVYEVGQKMQGRAGKVANVLEKVNKFFFFDSIFFIPLFYN